ncbi:hypothetical protein SK128_002467, partial [Halocaridina rubra]
MAIMASEYYLSILRDAIGDENFRRLFDLYAGSAMSIMIDTTGSMNGEIRAVKEEATLIVENTRPEMYILTPYKDPDLGPVTSTTDAEVFLQELDKLDAYGGCCCVEENFWGALELALAYTPDYSSIYCFTDAGGNDRHLMEGSIALAAAKHCQVTIIFSFDQTTPPTQNTTVNDPFCPEDEYFLTGVNEYKRLAAETGGLFIEIDKFDIDDITGILEDGVEESEVEIRMREGVTGTQTVTFPVDDSINYIQVLIVGSISTALLTDGGVTFDLTNATSLEGQPGVEVITISQTLKSIKFSNLTIGMWTLQVHSETTEYSASVSALSTLGFLAEFCELMLQPPRPSYRIIRGRPLMERKYYVEVTLVGYVDSRVDKVVSMELVDEKGAVHSHINYTGDVDDHFYIQSEVLPTEPFYIQIDGFLETESYLFPTSGSPFSRIFPTMVVPVNCAVELLIENSTLSARPGETADAHFRVTNYGPMAEFEYYANDEKLFITNWIPKRSTLDALGYVDIIVTFTVPNNALPGTVSTVTVTAASLTDGNNVNSAITYFSVLPEEQDSEAPSCVSNDNPDCTGFTTADTCANKTWTVVATLQDTKSGLRRISSTPSQNLTVDSFTEGTTDPVTAMLTTTCCQQDAEIRGVDGQGNVGRCEWVINEASTLLEFTAESVSQTWVYLRWTVNEVRDDLDKYTVITNNDLASDSGCREVTCYKNITFLDPCTLHHFELNPYFAGSKGPSYFTENATLPEAVTAPINPSTEYTSETSTTIKWEGTMDGACLLGYEVCYRRIDSSTQTCIFVTNTSATLNGLEACTVYFVEITTVAVNNGQSEALHHTTQTDEAAPGRPEKLRMLNQTGPYSMIAWDDPLSHASCVNAWIVAHKPLNLTSQQGTSSEHKNVGNESNTSAKSQNVQHIQKTNNGTTFFTFNDLLGCNMYEYLVSGVSASGLPGGTSIIYDETEEMNPREVKELIAVDLSPSIIYASWNPPEIKACLDHFEACIIDTYSATMNCFSTSDISYSFKDLKPCVYHQITVTSVSVTGLRSVSKNAFAMTQDIPTGPPTDLSATNITAHSVTVSYNPPSENPYCVSEYDIRVVDYSAVMKNEVPFLHQFSVLTEEILTDLKACTDYGVYISVKTMSGYASTEANVNFTTLVDTPSAPRELQTGTITQDSVDLMWFAPQ